MYIIDTYIYIVDLFQSGHERTSFSDPTVPIHTHTHTKRERCVWEVSAILSSNATPAAHDRRRVPLAL